MFTWHYYTTILISTLWATDTYDIINHCFLKNLQVAISVLACTPSLVQTTSRECLQSFLAHWRSRLAVGSGSVWTHMRTVPETPGSEILSLLRRSAMTTSQWWGYLAHLLLDTWCWKWHTTDQWEGLGLCGEPGHRWTQILSWKQAGRRDHWWAGEWWTTGRCCQLGYWNLHMTSGGHDKFQFWLRSIRTLDCNSWKKNVNNGNDCTCCHCTIEYCRDFLLQLY